jgi:hypothetical protein
MLLAVPAETLTVTARLPATPVAPGAIGRPVAWLITLWIEIDGCVCAATVTVTSCTRVGSATETTRTVAVPAPTPVTTQPGLVTVATVCCAASIEQVTPAAISAAEPVSVLVIVVVCCGEIVTAVGETVRVTGGRVTVSVAEACLVASAVAIAVMTVVPALFFAVTTPAFVTVATVVSDDVKVFAVFVLPVTFDTNVNVPPTSIDAAGGVIEIVTAPGIGAPVTVMIETARAVASAADVAVMTAVPFFVAFAVTTPVVETFATDVSEDA